MKPILSPLIAISVCTLAIAAESPKMRPLFNGKDLGGWTGEGYVVEDGAIVCTPEGKILSTEETFSAYVLEFDFKLPPGGNNGLCIHYPGSGDGTYTGMEIQILDNSDPKYATLKDNQLNGSLYTLVAAKNKGLKPVGEWNHERVTVAGPDVRVELNGEEILHANLDDVSTAHPNREGAKRRSGHIGWLGHGDRVAFRNIRISEIPPIANTERVIASGFKPLLAGEALDGWKLGESKGWTITDGILKHRSSPGEPSDLWSEKSYGDFTLVFDWRWSGRGPVKMLPVLLPDGTPKTGAEGHPELKEVEELNSGIFLRGKEGRVIRLSNGISGSGEVTAGLVPKFKADRPVGEWNRAMIVLKGDRLSVNLNGRTVIDNAPLPDLPATGAIGFQDSGASIDIANLWIKSP